MSSTSNTSSSGSSAAANTVVVTARDIEFSNYNSSTGKWDNAILTMMIEDANTPENLNLEVYDERVYAVFRNHDDPSDTVQTSAEVDGMDFRVTISTPMIASGKYELYKVYGETSGNEYATSSQFYIQVPGKVWDFANDVVEEDTELVSDWFNYGEIEDLNGNVYGAVTQTEMSDATGATSTQTFTINGVTLTPADVKRVKLTSLVSGKYGSKMNTTYRVLSADFCNGWNNLTDLDVVSSRITYIGDTESTFSSSLGSGVRGTSFNKKFAFPETLKVIYGWLNTVNIFNKPLYIPDSVDGIVNMMMSNTGNANYTSKIRFSPNIRFMGQGQNYGPFASLTNWAGSRKGLSNNVQLIRLTNRSGSSITTYYGFKGTPWTEDFQIPSVWTYIPSVMFADYDYSSEIVIPSNITEIKEYAFYHAKLTRIVLPSSITSIRDSFSIGCGVNDGNGLILDGLENTQITSLPANFLSGPSVNVSLLNIPSRITAYPNNMLTTATGLYGTVIANKDADGYFTYNIPEGIRTIGSNFLSERTSRAVYDQGTYGRVNRIVLPSTLTSVGVGFCGKIPGSRWSSPRNTYAVIVDATNVSPSIFQDNDTTSFAENYGSSSDWYEDVQIIVAPGTTEEWQSKLPDITTGTSKRRINWIEKPTLYGYVFYKTSPSDTREKYVELQSMTDFNKFQNSSQASYPSATVDDGNGGTITLNSRGSNVVTGFNVGTSITSLPTRFLYNWKYMSHFKIGENVTTIGTYVGCNWGYGSGSEHLFYGSIEIPPSVTTIGNYTFCYINGFNKPITIPSTVTSLPTSSDFFSRNNDFNSPITIESQTAVGFNFLNSFNNTITFGSKCTQVTSFLSYCPIFNQPITFPSTITSIHSSFYKLDAFNQSIHIPSSVIALNSSFYQLASFNSPFTFDSGTHLNYGSFLATLPVFNQPITLPVIDRITGVLLSMMDEFNQPITIPTGFGSNGWGGTYDYNYILYQCPKMVSSVSIETSYTPNRQYAKQRNFSNTVSTALSYTQGFNLTGTYASAWKNVLPDYDGTQTTPANTYRKINVV